MRGRLFLVKWGVLLASSAGFAQAPAIPQSPAFPQSPALPRPPLYPQSAPRQMEPPVNSGPLAPGLPRGPQTRQTLPSGLGNSPSAPGSAPRISYGSGSSG